MSDAPERLRRILAEERRRAFDDGAVSGGLDAFLTKVGGDPDPALRQALLVLPPEGYAGLSPARRGEWAQQMLDSAPSANGAPPTRLPPGGARRVAARRPMARPAPAAVTLATPVSALGGVRRDLAAKLAALGVGTVRDLLFFFPNRHADYARVTPISELEPGDDATIIGDIWSSGETRLGRRMRGSEAVVSDGSGTIRIVWFNQPWIAKQLPKGARVVFSGRVSEHRGTAHDGLAGVGTARG